MNYLPTYTSRLVVQHPCQVSFKSMQGCRRSWEDKLKCVKILSVKGHNSAKICRTWIISPYALLDLWYNIFTKFHSNPCKDVGGVEKTNFDGTEMTEGRNDGQSKHLMPPCHFMAGAWKLYGMRRFRGGGGPGVRNLPPLLCDLSEVGSCVDVWWVWEGVQSLFLSYYIFSGWICSPVLYIQ